MEDGATISVIVPTMADAQRKAKLIRALESLRTQVGTRAIPIVVVNGTRSDPSILDCLKSRPDIRLVLREEGNLPKALAAGRDHVNTKYFGVLDDDDEYLPHALSIRRKPLDFDDTVDVVATSGFLSTEHGDKPYLADIESFRGNPLGGLEKVNWLPSCGALYRTDRVGPEMFLAMPKFLEWTYVAVQLSLSCKIVFVAQPTFRLDTSTPGSLSKSMESVVYGTEALDRILSLDLPKEVRRLFRRRYIASLHHASAINVRNGDDRSAWKYHLRSLASPNGLKYLPYTRRVLVLSARKWLGLI